MINSYPMCNETYPKWGLNTFELRLKRFLLKENCNLFFFSIFGTSNICLRKLHLKSIVRSASQFYLNFHLCKISSEFKLKGLITIFFFISSLYSRSFPRKKSTDLIRYKTSYLFRCC